MAYYTIRNCQENELFLLQEFINKHWKEKHILSISQELICFQHQNKTTKEYNFLLGICPNTGDIHGIIGYIPTSQYDSELTSHDYWGAIWKVREDINNTEIKLLGLALWEELSNRVHTFAAIGISGIAKKFYKIAKLKVGVLNHFYILREQIQSYKIAKVNTSMLRDTNKKTVLDSKTIIERVEISDKRLLSIKPIYTPLKSIKYIINRYALHPFYKYNFWFVSGSNVLLITRTLDINGGRAIRIVDCLGDMEQLPKLGNEFQEILKKENAEYIDCLNYGISDDIFYKIGFQLLSYDQDDIIIPNYIEPLLQTNIKIEFAYKSPTDERYVIFKGDSDQDRPNIL